MLEDLDCSVAQLDEGGRLLGDLPVVGDADDGSALPPRAVRLTAPLHDPSTAGCAYETCCLPIGLMVVQPVERGRFAPRASLQHKEEEGS